jgi:hypothetical protein
MVLLEYLYHVNNSNETNSSIAIIWIKFNSYTWYSSEDDLGNFDTSLCGPQEQKVNIFAKIQSNSSVSNGT